MSFEAIEPTHCGLAALGYMGEDSMRVNPAIVADSNGHGVYEGDATASTFSRHEIAAQRKQCT